MFEKSHPFFHAILQGNKKLMDKFKEELTKEEIPDIISNDYVSIGVFNNPYQINLLECSVLYNRLELTNFLLSYISPGSNSSRCIAIAAYYSNIDMLELLLNDPRSNPGDCSSEALVWAIAKLNNEAANLLLTHPKTKPDAYFNRPLNMAIGYGNIEIIPTLLRIPSVRSQFDANEFVTSARTLKHFPLVLKVYYENKSLFDGLNKKNRGFLNELIESYKKQFDIVLTCTAIFDNFLVPDNQSFPRIPPEISSLILSKAFTPFNAFGNRNNIESCSYKISQKLSTLRLRKK